MMNQPEQAAYDLACMLDCINNVTTRASRNMPPTTLPLCSTVIIMKLLRPWAERYQAPFPDLTTP